MLSLITICLAWAVSANYGDVVGPITITENGQKVTRYVLSTWSGGASTNGTAMFLKHNSQIQIGNVSGGYEANGFVEYILQGKTVSFTVDLSSIGCSCNAALYFVTMPGIGSNGQPNAGSGGNYYCDANDVGGQWCWELDVMEANQYVTQSTPHECYQAPGTYITSCDRGGCATNSHNVNGNGMGPGSNYQINTQMPFRYSMSLSGSAMSVSLTQGSANFQFSVCNQADYLSSFNAPLNYGMVMVASYWGSDWNTMSWLDGQTGCQGDCDGSGTAIFGDIEIA